MRGGINANYVIEEMKRQEYYKKKAVRMKCLKENKKQCDKCQYEDICYKTEEQNS